MGEPSEPEQDIWDKLFRPEILQTFFDPYEDAREVKIHLFTTPTGPSTETIVLNPFFPFSTIDDMKLAIYNQKGKDPAFAPEHQFLAFQPSLNPAPEGERGKYYQGLDFYFKDANLLEPFGAATAQGWDTRFVDSEGNRKILEGASRGRSCFEDVILEPRGGSIPQLHLFLLRDILSAIRLPKPLSQPEYNGRVLSYFPATTSDSDGITLTEKQKANLQALHTYYLQKQSILEEKLLPIIEGETEFVFENFPKIKDVKYLRFTWLQKPEKKALDTLFYEIPVSHSRPFLRYFPADSVPITKVQVRGVLPIPDLADPCLLLQWAKEKSPTSERDFLLGKVAIEQLFEGSYPIYATLQAVDDGTAALVLEPPKPLKRLDPMTDLKLLKESVQRGVQGFPFATKRVDINEANMVASIRLPTGQPKITPKEMLKRLKPFRGFFQETFPISGETPLLALRYKAVSNFFNESRVGVYLEQLSSRHILNPTTAVEDMINIIAEEFSLTRDEASREFQKWKATKEEIVPIEPEYELYKLKYNPGIDILIYSQHPDYYFHLYRVDSYQNLRRILTLLTVMFTAPKDLLGIEPKQIKVLEEAAEASLPKVGEDAAEGIVGSAALAAEGRLKEAPVAVEEEEDGGDTGDAGEISEWDFFDASQDDSPESVAEAVSAAKASRLVAEQQQKPVQLPKVAPAPAGKAPGPEVAVQASKLGIPTANYFIRKLQEADSRLFEYTKGIKGLKKYVSVCAANEHRQPAVLDKTGYDRMMATYKQDMERDEIDIITYEFEKGLVSLRKKPLPYKTKEQIEEHTFMVLKYGTDIFNQKYYLCAEYFCLRDEILIRKDEFLGTKFRETADPELIGKTKEPNRCPFCNGKLIANYPEVNPGETVFPREVNISNKVKKHTHIGFYSKRLHPEGFGLPCCFTSPQKIKTTDEWFNPLKEMSRKLRREGAEFEDSDEDEDEDEEETTAPAQVVTGAKPPNYQDTLLRVYKKYIVGPEKMPLETGGDPQIGLLPPSLNEYFNQSISDMVQRAQIRQELKSDARGFLRIGVDNRGGHRAESFFAAVAPFFERNSADQLRALLKSPSGITPRVFVNANFGNLMMEFYDNKTLVFKKEILPWAFSKLGIPKKEDNYEYAKRIYNAYTNFWGAQREGLTSKTSFLDDKTRVKQYRQFAHLFAQPRIFNPGNPNDKGILFIVLDIQSDGSIDVICPPFGYSDAMINCDIGFLLHQGDIWEPIFYVDNKIPGEPLVTLRFQKALQASWPAIVKQRIQEFRTKCKGPNKATYTGIQSLVPGTSLMNFAQAERLIGAPYEIVGVVRNLYNHLVAVLVQDPDPEESGLIPVPIADDGIIRPSYTVYPDWEGFTPAPANRIIEFYKAILPKIAVYPGSPTIAASYQPVFLMTPPKKDTKQVIQLANGVYIPISPPQPGTQISLPPPPTAPQVLEWDINRDIMLDKISKEIDNPLKVIESETELQEIYEHFRLLFSNWLASPDAGQQMREDIQSVLFPISRNYGIDLPIFEKRKRLQILLSPFLMTWMDNKDPAPKPFQSLLRIDCRDIKTTDRCKYPCVWRQQDSETGKCYLHTPKEKEGALYTIPQVFLARLIEELIRFPSRRDEILPTAKASEKKRFVSHLVAISSPVRLGDTYIIPENSMEWIDQLRIECKKTMREKPIFFEEISSDLLPTEATQALNKVPSLKITPLPEQVRQMFGGDDPRTNAFGLYEWDPTFLPGEGDLAKLLKVLEIPTEVVAPPTANVPKEDLTENDLSNLAGYLQTGVVQITVGADAESTTLLGRRVPARGLFYVLVKQGPSLRFALKVGSKQIEPIDQEELPVFFANRVKKLKLKIK